MKTNIIAYLLLAFLTGNIITSCSEEELSDVSIFDESLQSEPNELDKWIEKTIYMPTTSTLSTEWRI